MSSYVNFEFSYSFLIKPFFCITKKPGQKCKNVKNEKSFEHEKKKAFLFILKGGQSPEIVSDPIERL